MRITRCTACKGDNIYEGSLNAQGGVVLGRKKPKFSWTFIRVKCAACLTCGAVFPYIEPEDCEKVKRWKAEDSSATVSYEGGSRQQDSGNLVRIMIVLAALGVLAAIVIPQFMHAADQIK